MKPITLKEALLTYVDAVLVDGPAPQLYLKDEDNHYRDVYEIDLNCDGMICYDGYWSYYEDIVEAENSEKHILFIGENNNE